MRPWSALPPVLLAACAAGPPTPDGTERPAPPPGEVRHAVPAGTRIRLLAAESPAAATVPLPAFDGLLREAMVQTARFDLAAGATDAPSPWRLRVAADPGARALTTALEDPEGTVTPLAAAVVEGDELAAAVDRLAIRTRQALGEEIDTGPVPSALAHSSDGRGIRRAEEAWGDLLAGEYADARRGFAVARRRDGGSPVVLIGLAATHLLLGDFEAARATATEGLTYDHRLHPPARHRLTRILLQARAAADPLQAGARDEELLRFARVGHVERPHDVQPVLSEALALNFLGRFEESAPLLRTLRERLPRSFLPAYHLAYAELALDRPEAALDAIAAVEGRLPTPATVLPRALALYHAGRHEELDRFLAELTGDPQVRRGAAMHEVLRMRAAHALLTNRRERAVALLLEDLAWLHRRPSLLAEHAIDLAEEGEVLVRLGAHRELERALAGFDDLGHLPAVVADARVFLGGLVHVARTGSHAEVAERTLRQRQGRFQVWGNVVKAFAHRARGELADEASALAAAAEAGDDPLVKAALARAWQEMGRGPEAGAMVRALERELLVIDLRRPSRHPLLHPGTALAFLLPR